MAKLGSAAREAIALLKETFPLPFPVRVYMRKVIGDGNVYGCAAIEKSRAGGINGNIYIVEGLESYTETLVAAHEYAHLMVMEYPGADSDAVWSVAYNECYSMVFGPH